jgi:hypothetical protein
MEISQGNSLWHLKQAKMSCFSFHLFSFFFYKAGEQEGRTMGCNQWERGVGGQKV